jgi:hypothetical protein
MALKHDLKLVDDFHGIATLDDVLHHRRRDVVEHLALVEHGIGLGQAFDLGLIFGTGDYERLRYLDQLRDRRRGTLSAMASAMAAKRRRGCAEIARRRKALFPINSTRSTPVNCRTELPI